MSKKIRISKRNFFKDKNGRIDQEAVKQHADILQKMIAVARGEENEWKERAIKNYTWKWYYWIMIKFQSKFLGWFSFLRFNRNENTKFLEIKRFGKTLDAMYRGPYI